MNYLVFTSMVVFCPINSIPYIWEHKESCGGGQTFLYPLGSSGWSNQIDRDRLQENVTKFKIYICMGTPHIWERDPTCKSFRDTKGTWMCNTPGARNELRCLGGFKRSLQHDKKTKHLVCKSLHCPIDRSKEVISHSNSCSGQGP